MQSVIDFQAEVGRGYAEFNRVVGAVFGGILILSGAAIIGNGLVNMKHHHESHDPNSPDQSDTFTPKQHVYLGIGLVGFGALVVLMTWSLARAVRHGSKGFAAVLGTVGEMEFVKDIVSR